MSIEEGEEIKTKGIDNLFNRIIAENFPNLPCSGENIIQLCP
jgi:hypothetical protein